MLARHTPHALLRAVSKQQEPVRTATPQAAHSRGGSRSPGLYQEGGVWEPQGEGRLVGAERLWKPAAWMPA